MLARLRQATTAIGDPAVGEDNVVVSVRLTDGRTVGMKLEQSLGNLARPLSDARLEAKFRDQTTVIPAAQADAAIAACWGVAELDDVATLIGHCVPAR